MHPFLCGAESGLPFLELRNPFRIRIHRNPSMKIPSFRELFKKDDMKDDKKSEHIGETASETTSETILDKPIG